MSRFEAALTLGWFFIVVVFFLWLLVSRQRARRRVPPRVIIEHDHPLEPGFVIPVHGDPRRLVIRRQIDRLARGFEWFDWPVQGAKPYDWARDLHTPDWSRQRV